MLKIAMIIFPKIEPLDHYGPYRSLGRMEANGKATLKLLSHSTDAVHIGHRTYITPDGDYKDPNTLYDLIMIPGGSGQVDVMSDKFLEDFIIRHYENKKYVSSVCTGALLLGNAGILKNKKATTYWKAEKALAQYGAIVQNNVRIVHDDIIITASGVTSGIDLAHYLIQLLFGEHIAQLEILNSQYAPSPLYNCGIPQHATDILVEDALKESNALNCLREQQAEIWHSKTESVL